MSSNITSDPPGEPVLTVDTREELMHETSGGRVGLEPATGG